MKRNLFQDQISALKELRVLVVEANIDNRGLYTVVLEGVGAEVTAVGSAREALVAMAEFNPHLLISDIALPDENGYTFIRKLRAIEAPLGKIPALAITGFIDSQARSQALSAGFNHWLPKPIDLDLFLHTILEMIGLDVQRLSA